MEQAENQAVQSAKALLAKKPAALLYLIGAVVVLIAIVVIVVLSVGHSSDASSGVSVVSVPTLQKIVNVNELSTFTAVYNGVAKGVNEKDSKEIDYYVSYNAKVNAGIDVKQIQISIDEERKVITILLPEVYITDINVKTSSLDFIFMDEDSNTNTVVAQAYKLCEEDVREESEQQTEIKNLAKLNAINIITALTKPFVEQLDFEYTLVIK